MKDLFRLLATLGLLLCALDRPATATAGDPVVSPAPSRLASSGRDWIVKAADNICGLHDANQLSSPAVVDFSVLMAATPEMKKMRDQKIDPSTPDGIALKTAAVNRVTTACETVRVANGNCSVWKEIKHKDGRAIADVTEKVKALL
jgi:hypothetical protein